MPKIESLEDLQSLKRRQLQKLAKKHGIKANLKSVTIVKELEKILILSKSNTNSSSKRSRVSGHIIEYNIDKHGNKKSNICLIVLTNTTYFTKILLYLSYFDNINASTKF